MKKYVGQSIKRKEDYPFLTGKSRYVADMKMAGQLEVAFVRSTQAHAIIKEISTEEAERVKGVHAVLTAKDIAGKIKPLPPMSEFELPQTLIDEVKPKIYPCPEEILASYKVVYVGQPIAVVLAENRYVAEDAATLVKVTYEPLPVVDDPYKAMEPETIQIHEQIPNNVQSEFNINVGDVHQAFSQADHVLELTIKIPRCVSSPIETRGVLAHYEPNLDQLTVWSSTQVPYMVRKYIHMLLDLPENNIRVIAPNVGGGFGLKAAVFPDEILMAYLSKTFNRPIKWVEDRLENLLASRHARDQIHKVKISFNNDGTITGLKDQFVQDCGAYNPLAMTLAYNTAAHIRGLYKINNYNVIGKNVLTNKTPVIPARGAGRPEAAFTMDRIIDKVAETLNMDPVEVMFKNLIRPEEMPYDTGMYYRDGEKLIYDSGNYLAMLNKALELIDYNQFRSEQEKLKQQGKYIGIGFSSYIEGTGIGPFEGALVQLDATGQIIIKSGTCPHGQSHATTFSQICADELNISPDQVIFQAGDTALLPYGVGTFASRSAVVGGTSVKLASQQLRKKILAIAAEMLQVDASSLVMENGKVYVKDSPHQSVSFQEIARAAKPGPRARGNRVPEGMEPGVEAVHYFVPPTVTYSSGIHVAVVEVDIETGFIKILRYVVIHDCGKAINPMIVDAQIQGGVAHGIGEALFERMVYDEKGQLLTGTYMDYLLTLSTDMPQLELAHFEELSPRNPDGIKGVGEGGAISPPGAIANAIADALRPIRIDIDELPVSPSYVYQKIQEAKQAADSSL